MNPNTTGKNITSIPTSTIQKSLGIASDNIYGPQTTSAVKAFQSANGLVSDGIFGPKTQAVYNTKYGTGGSIVSTGEIHKEAKTNSSALNNALNMVSLPTTLTPANTTGNTAMNTTTTDPITGVVSTSPNPTPTTSGATPAVTPDPYMDMLNNMSAKSNASTKMLIQNIQAQKTNQANKINKEFENYKSGLQLLGIQQNAAQSSPDLLMGHLLDAENQHMDKINTLNSEEAKALMDAENARADNDFKLLQQSMAHYKDIQTAKTQALKDYNDSLMNQPKVATIAAHDIYSTMNTLDDVDKETFLIAVAKKFNLPLASLTTALVDEKKKLEAETLKTENTQSIIDKREAPPTTTTQTTANKKNDIANAVLTFKDIIKKNNWRGIDPNQYKQVSDSIKKDYGANAVLELEKAIKAAGLQIDNGDKTWKADTTKKTTTTKKS